ncbi:MAG: magnesium/cobalt transporter CorA [Candidatus Lokiarchaeota archaeon]|nr:magnesium/cobalt transporter CorA [Candidatus Lokiarchaeota archaeon]MBD3200517.1 magnesium/cobalt transporter CorA [Candidatus Lokiarchaeota archaeon]
MSKRIYEKFRKNKKYSKIGEPPGTIQIDNEKQLVETSIQIINYNKESYTKEHVNLVDGNIKQTKNNMTKWIKIVGLKNIRKIEKIGEYMLLHPLVLEDIASLNQRPKYEDYNDYLFIVLKMIVWDNLTEDFIFEQVSIILGQDFVVSVEEKQSEFFNPIIERIETSKGRLRSMGADYLTYALIDLIIDHYFLNQELLGEYIQELEDKLIKNPEVDVLESIYNVKRKVIDLRKSIWPMREVINQFQRADSELISQDLQIYLRDLYDHIYRINDSLQNYREIVTGMLDLYLSSVSNKMNEIMKVLTIISTIFIPLSFIAGFYGMNFRYMPELESSLGYPLLIIAMISIGLIMVFYFRKRNWI